MKFLTTFFVSLILSAPICFSQQISMSPIGGPVGKIISSIEVNNVGHILALAESSELFRSTDGGSTWEGIIDTSGVTRNDLAFHPDGSFYYIGGDRFLYKIPAGSIVPEQIDIDPDISVGYTGRVLIDEFGVIFATSLNGLIQKSSDGGASWELIFDIDKFKPNNLDVSISKYFVVEGEDYIYFTHYFSEESPRNYYLYQLKKDGTEVTKLHEGSEFVYHLIKHTSGKIIFSAGDGAYIKDVNASDWTFISGFKNNVTWVEEGKDGVLIFTDSLGYRLTNDFGNTFTRKELFNPGANSGFSKVVYDSGIDQYFILQSNSLSQNLFRVDSSFDSWMPLAPGGRDFIKENNISFRTSNGFLFAKTDNHTAGFYFSDDAGQTFAPLLIDNQIGIKNLVKGSADLIFAFAENDKIYRSSDFGANWQIVLEDTWINKKEGYSRYLAAGYSGEIIASAFTDSATIKYSNDNGNTWKDIFNSNEEWIYPLQFTNEGKVLGRTYKFQVSDSIYSDTFKVLEYTPSTDTWEAISEVKGFAIEFNASATGFIRMENFVDSFYAVFNMNIPVRQEIVSDNGGKTFVRDAGHSFISAPNGYLFAFDNRDIKMSKNSGLSWETIYTHPTSEKYRNLYLDDENYLYAAFEFGAIHKSTQLLFDDNFIVGDVFVDADDNCIYDTDESAYPNVIVRAIGQDTFYVTTRSDGRFVIPVPPGNYEVSAAVNAGYWKTCDSIVNVSLAGVSDTVFVDFAAQSIVDCPSMLVDLTAPFLRRCFDNTYFVDYCNKGTVEANNSSVDITLDSRFSIINSSIPYTTVRPNVYNFSIGNVDVFECGKFRFTTEMICDSVLLSETVCAEAHIYPDSVCVPPNPVWSGASLQLTGTCEGDSMRFRIRNVGIGDMIQPRQYIVIEDVALMRISDPFTLPSGDELEFPVPAEGQTIHVAVAQVAGHPGSSAPSLTLEKCGDDSQLVLGLFNQFGQDDANPYLDIECREIIGSFDPNDKSAVPVGLDVDHKILPNTDIEYLIRFQNTGTDTAFTVQIFDTLSPYVEVTSLIVGASSHDYTYELSGEGILKFRFDDIMLPDSNINLAGSNGFVKYKISMKDNAPIGETIFNAADIYFDYNDPVYTNQTYHLISVPFITVQNQEIFIPETEVKVYPNPFSETAIMELKSESDIKDFQCFIFDVSGRLVWSQDSDNQMVVLDGKNFNPGIYFYKIQNKEGVIASGKLLAE